MLFLVGLTTMIIFPVAASWDLGLHVTQRLQSGDLFAALEDIQMDMESQVSSVPRPGIEGRLLPRTDPPALDENDNFMLPPPAYGLHEDFDGGDLNEMSSAGEPDYFPLTSEVSSVPRPGIEGRILPITDLPTLDENDDFMLPPPAYEL